jgi:NADPH-dependent curcumin reductase CurA
MSERQNRQIVLQRRPVGEPREDDFGLVTTDVPDPAVGEMLLGNLWLSLDPYMRGRMNDMKSYAPPVPLGGVMVGGTVSQVLASRIPEYRQGDIVSGNHGWQQFAIARPDDDRLARVDPDLAPVSTAIGVLGMPGFTAYFGLLRVGEPKAGETVVVSAAAGAVGSAVGQIARIQGCRAVGVAGGPVKCKHVVEELGFDACVDYKAGNLEADLRAACPDGIDVYFENVGGAVLDAVVPLLNPGARVPICGFISAYNARSLSEVRTPLQVLGALDPAPAHRFFLVREWIDEYPEAIAALAGWIKEGRLVYRETIAEGLESAPRAFIGMLRGENLGKQLVRIAEPEPHTPPHG